MTTWSYSSLSSFEQCPRRYAVIRVHKLVADPPNAASKHGDEVHKALELYVKDGTALPVKYAQYEPIVSKIAKSPGDVYAEQRFALTRDIKPTTFFAPDCWVRGVLDVTVVRGAKATVLDYKTGKPKNDPDQLKLFAAAVFGQYPEVDTVKTGYLWLAYDIADTEIYTRSQAADIWKSFEVRVERLEHAMKYDEFPPKPSGLCKNYCPVPKNICEFSGRS